MHTLQPVITEFSRLETMEEALDGKTFEKNAGIVRGMKFSKRILKDGLQPCGLDFDDQGPHMLPVLRKTNHRIINTSDVLDDFPNYSASIHKFKALADQLFNNHWRYKIAWLKSELIRTVTYVGKVHR